LEEANTMPTRPIDEDARLRNEKAQGTAKYDTTPPAEPEYHYKPGEAAAWEGFGAVHKDSDSDAQPPVEPGDEDEEESPRDPVKEGV
jgi:hypothetical protein